MENYEENPFLAWRLRCGLTLEQLAERLGKPRSYTGNLSKLERGLLGYSDELLQALADVYDTTKAKVLAGPPRSGAKAESPSALYESNDRYAFIEKLDVKIAGGDGYLSEFHEVDGKYPLPMRVVRQKNLNVANLRVATVVGSSMEHYLYHGDEVVVDIKDRKIVNNKVFVLHMEDGERVKRLFKQLDGKIRVVSDNENKLVYPDEFLTPDTPFNICGKIVHRSGG